MSMTKELSHDSFCRLKVMMIPHPHDSQRSEVEKSMLNLETLDYESIMVLDNENKVIGNAVFTAERPASQTNHAHSA